MLKQSKHIPATKFRHFMMDNEPKITRRQLETIAATVEPKPGYKYSTLKNWIDGRSAFPYHAMLFYSTYFNKSLDELFGA